MKRAVMCALLVAAVAGASGYASPLRMKPVLPFIEDDYGRALAEARARKTPIFIESWAPW